MAGKSSRGMAKKDVEIERVQLGIRLEKKMTKVLKALAEYFDVSLTEMMESIVLHSLEGEGVSAFSKDVLPKIKEIKKVYGMNYGVHDSQHFREN